MWQLMGDDEMSALLKLVPAFYMCSIAYTSKTTMAQVCRCLSATWESAHDELAFMHLSSLAKIRGWMTQEECADVGLLFPAVTDGYVAPMMKRVAVDVCRQDILEGKTDKLIAMAPPEDLLK